MALLIIISSLLLLAMLVSRLLIPNPNPQSPNKPPILIPRMPLIGHIIGFLRYKIFYLEHLASKCSSPIFTLRIFTYEFQIITSPSLLSLMHRHPSPSFDPMIIAITDSIIGDSPTIRRLMHAGPNSEGVNGYLVDTHASLHTSMTPESGLWDMNAKVLRRIAEMVNAIPVEGGEDIGLWQWIRDGFTRATSEALYGEFHPLAVNPGLVEAVWDADTSQIPSLFLHALLSYLPYSVHRLFISPLKIRTAFQAYYFSPSAYLHPSVSSLVKARLSTNLTHSIPISETANAAHGLLFVATTNAVPTIFWFILFVFSNPSLVRELRTHIEESGVVKEIGKTSEGKRMLKIEYTEFKEKCPKLVNAYNETMRLTNIQSGARVASSDFFLSVPSSSSSSSSSDEKERTYFLKTNSLILAPSRIPHLSTQVWGPDSHEFKPERWENLTKEQRKAFVPFGGGKHLCPGREFAFAEIVGMMAVLVLGFEIEGLGGEGRVGATLEVPEGRVMGIGVVGPDKKGKELRVGIRRREGWEGDVWSFYRGDRRRVEVN